MQHPFGSENEHAIAVNDWAATRARVVAVQVFVFRRIGELPELLARFRVQTGQPCFASPPFVLQITPAADRSDTVAFTQFALPHEA